MLYALSSNGDKIRPEPGVKATCPFCGNAVIAKCGLINTHHWAHEPGADAYCVTAEYESESEWHFTYKGLFHKENVEVAVEKNGKLMRADVKLDHGLVLEIQHSSISAQIIQARNRFHGNIAWLFDASGPFAQDRIHYRGMDGLDKIINRKGRYGWIRPRKSIRYAGGEEKHPVFIDIGFGKILELQDVWYSLSYLETGDREKYGEHTRQPYLSGIARAFANYEEFVQRLYELDENLKERVAQANPAKNTGLTKNQLSLF